MVTHKDQLDLFKLISQKINKDTQCYAFGGNAMMFYGYKDETKDIDLLFGNESEKKEFISAIEKLGFEETSALKIYIPEKLKQKHKPLMFSKDDFRFDIFTKKIFRTQLSSRMEQDLYAIHEFKDKNTLKIKVLRKEHLVLLKAITERDRDFEDIITILSKEKDFEWQYLIDEVIWQHQHGDKWAILDMEKTMQELKEYILIQEKYFKQLYKSQK